jgi:hypothetical protein
VYERLHEIHKKKLIDREKIEKVGRKAPVFMSRAKSFDRVREEQSQQSKGSPGSQRSRSPNQTYLYDLALK